MQNNPRAKDFFKKIFEPESIGKIDQGSETLVQIQAKLKESDQKCDIMSKLNIRLANELRKSVNELEALKRTIVKTSILEDKKDKKSQKQQVDDDIQPSYLKVMRAE